MIITGKFFMAINSLSLSNSGVSAKILVLYVEWHVVLSKHVPKTLRYSLGIKIDALFAEVVESIALAQFSKGKDRLEYIEKAIGKNDTLKFMLCALYELRGIDEKKMITLSEKAAEVGRMLYGWRRSVETRNLAL